jgi:peptidoglycan/xylan/chitin deacetylase (PgdA/CDA1 family)
LGPLVVLVVLSAPFWSAAARFVGIGAHPDSLRVPILLYHSIAPNHPGQTAEQRELDVDTATFRQQMDYLAANHFNVVSLSALVDALQGKGSVPPRSVVITFDDGWLTQYENALPILQRLHFTATFFVITKQVGLGPKYMTLEQVQALQRAGMTIASHSRTHCDLTKANTAELRSEIAGSRADLQKMLGINTDLFAYPYGAWNKRVAAAARGAGFRAARAAAGGAWNDLADQFSLHSVVATDDMAAFVRDVSGTRVIASSIK